MLPIFDRVRVRVSIRFNVQMKYSNSMICKISLSASWLVRELSSPRLDWQRVGLSANCPVSVYSLKRIAHYAMRQATSSINELRLRWAMPWPAAWCITIHHVRDSIASWSKSRLLENHSPEKWISEFHVPELSLLWRINTVICGNSSGCNIRIILMWCQL